MSHNDCLEKDPEDWRADLICQMRKMCTATGARRINDLDGIIEALYEDEQQVLMEHPLSEREILYLIGS